MMRPYVAGDDVRRIDWNATARTGEPYVRVDLAERVLVTWLVLEISVSMQFGTADRRKADVVEGVAVAIGHLATRRGNRLGVVAFGGREAHAIPPRQGRASASSASSLPCAASRRPTACESSLAVALARTGALSRGNACSSSSYRTSAVLVNGGGPRSSSPGHHDVIAVEIRDPREQELADRRPPVPRRPRDRRQLRVDTRSRRLRERFAVAAMAERGELWRSLSSVGVRHIVLTTSGDWLRPLAPSSDGAARELHLASRSARSPRPSRSSSPCTSTATGVGSQAAFGNPNLLPNVVDREPGRLRYLPPVLMLVGLVFLIVGVA